LSYFHDKERVFKISRLRVVYFVMFCAAFLLTEFGRYIYRPFIYSNGIDDFGIADTMGNSLGTVTQIFFMMAILHSNRKQGFRVIGFITVGYMLYEVAQLYLPKGTFDWKDMLATAAAGVIALIPFILIQLFFKENPVEDSQPGSIS